MHKKLMIGLIGIMLTFGIGDYLTTMMFVNKLGIGIEGAYIARWLINYCGFCGLIILKVLSILTLYYLIYRLYHNHLQITAYSIIILTNLLGTIITINNYLAFSQSYTCPLISYVPIMVMVILVVIYYAENIKGGIRNGKWND